MSVSAQNLSHVSCSTKFQVHLTVLAICQQRSYLNKVDNTAMIRLEGACQIRFRRLHEKCNCYPSKPVMMSVFQCI